VDADRGPSAALGATIDGVASKIGWVWEIRRGSSEQRFVRVEAARGSSVVTDLPAEARNAIRSRGATAVDAYLYDDTPPERLLVSTDGLAG
jgi:hypothetical protein